MVFCAVVNGKCAVVKAVLCSCKRGLVAACHWLEKPRRHVVPVKAKQQAYFKNVFYATSIDTAGNETDDSPGSELDAAEGSDEPAAKKGRHF